MLRASSAPKSGITRLLRRPCSRPRASSMARLEAVEARRRGAAAGATRGSTSAKRMTQMAAYASTRSFSPLCMLRRRPRRAGTSSSGRRASARAARARRDGGLEAAGRWSISRAQSSPRPRSSASCSSVARGGSRASSMRVRAQRSSDGEEREARGSRAASASFMSGCWRPPPLAGDDLGVLAAPLLHDEVDDGQVRRAEDAERRGELPLRRRRRPAKARSTTYAT